MVWWMLAFAMMGAIFGCGDIPNVQVDVTFPDEATEIATRRLLFIAREVPNHGQGDGCVALWSAASENLPEIRSVIDYPNRVDILGAAVRLPMYPSLSVLIYAHPSKDVSASKAIAGGCANVPIDSNGTVSVEIPLRKPPA